MDKIGNLKSETENYAPPRRDPGYRQIDERVRDWRAVEKRLDEAGISEQASRCLNCGTPFCHGAGCPLKSYIPELNELVRRKMWPEALDLLLSTNNFPEFTGRICPALCEAACVLSINGEATAIRQIELTIIETAYAKHLMRPRPPLKRLNQKVAVIGSGPAGLAAADELNHAGFLVTVYDSDLKAGGILRYGIPDFKLEKWLIDRRVELMAGEGVTFEMNASIGDDISARYLLNRYDAICLAGGAREPRDLQVEGRDLRSIHFALDYLIQQNQINADEPPAAERILATAKNVLVIGGGDTGSDCVGTAIRQGARKVCQVEILPKPPLRRSAHNPWPDWPNILRTSSSHQEGCERVWGAVTRSFAGKAGAVSAIRCARVEWSSSADGNKMKIKPGSEFEIEADLVLIAMGFVGPKKSKLVDDLGLETDKRNIIAIDENCATNVEKVFAAGDMTHGATLVVKAIADGRRSGESIIRYLRRKT